ncbi:sensor domain-containing protein [Catenulispora subtropica]|uniref:PknH-like extracellular domain-containing protein n=1 Tax=Catenulispora subtropica TaxID=450798 RepID=A0ABP5EIA2_9ACTN
MPTGPIGPTGPAGPTAPTGFAAPSEPAAGRRRTVVALGVVLVLLVAAGGATWAFWPKDEKAPAAANPRHIVPGTLQAAVLTPDEASRVLGTTVVAGLVVDQPPAALAVDPASCAVAAGPATASGYPQGWTVFLATTYQDSAGVGDYSLTQTVGVYGAADQAAGVFGKLGDGLKGCQSATRTDANKNSVKWNYSVDNATADTIAWTASQDSGGGWACYRQARLKGKDIVQVAICEGGDGKAGVAAVADQLTARVGG